MDYIFRWLQLRFLTGQQQLLFDTLRPRISGTVPPTNESMTDMQGQSMPEAKSPEPRAGSIHATDALAGLIDLGDAPTCSFCGSIMTRNGSCYRCSSCGSTSGCS
jgi:ribonucleoside-diphosphate reductase alpha chain